MPDPGKIKEVATVFIKLGFIAFGGPAAHISMMEKEIVAKRKWVSPEHFLDLVGATNLIPGPNSTEMAMHCGHERAGWKGLIVAGLSFILPAILLTSILAWLYHSYGQLPEIMPFIYGIQPAVIAIILSAVFTLGKKALKNTFLTILGVLIFLACLAGLHEIFAIFLAGVIGIGYSYVKKLQSKTYTFLSWIFLQISTELMPATNTKIFLIFLKVGSLLYGSGYVLFAFLDAELVQKGLLSQNVLLDAIAMGQFTPGPVLSTATFVGWQMNGLEGSLLATLGIFLPSFFFVGLLNPIIPRMRRSRVFSAFLDAVNIAAVAVILVVAVEMGQEVLIGWRELLIAFGSIIVTLKFKQVNSAFVVVGGSLTGYLLFLL